MDSAAKAALSWIAQNHISVLNVAGSRQSEDPAAYGAYDDSCVHCHGANGAGNPISDRFWKIRTPRLNGAYVQNKSDAELTLVILNGKRTMPPAMRGNPDLHRTKVHAEQVPDLIAYIRSQKKSPLTKASATSGCREDLSPVGSRGLQRWLLHSGLCDASRYMAHDDLFLVVGRLQRFGSAPDSYRNA
jgi:mono/diheme cytochrome c family protein